MKLGLRWLLLPVTALLLVSCAAPYGGGYYGGYADYAYPNDYYPSGYGGFVSDGGFHHFDHHFGHHVGALHSGMSFHGGHGGGHHH